jgi:hypothetical protein
MTTLPRQGGILPGGPDDQYIRVPVLAMLFLAPLMGGLYVMFLPFIGFAMVFSLLGRKSAALAYSGFMEVATTVAPRWQPGEAYLAGKRKAKKTDGDAAADKTVEDGKK